MNKQKKFNLIIRFIFVCISLSLLGGCASIHPNPKLVEEIDLTEVIRKKLNPPDRSDELFFILTLSGGGTRAAALGYGVMEALDKVVVPTTALAAGATSMHSSRKPRWPLCNSSWFVGAIRRSTKAATKASSTAPDAIITASVGATSLNIAAPIPPIQMPGNTR